MSPLVKTWQKPFTYFSIKVEGRMLLICQNLLRNCLGIFLFITRVFYVKIIILKRSCISVFRIAHLLPSSGIFEKDFRQFYGKNQTKPI